MSWPVLILIGACVLTGVAGAAALALAAAKMRQARSAGRAGAPGHDEAAMTAGPPPATDGDAETTERLARDRAALDERSRALEQADRLRNQLISKMSHDLRTPLNSVITLSQLLHEGTTGPLGFEQRKYVEIIHRSGRTLLALINDVLDLAYAEAGRLEIDAAPVDIRSVVQAVTASAAEMGRTKGLPFHVNAPREALLARADEERLRQVLLNIAEHAIHETANGYVELSVDGDPQRIAIRISDTGPGRTKPIRGASFDDYLAGATGPAPGLGLILAGKLVGLMGGTLTVDSAAGEGTTFTIALPRMADDARDAAAREGEPPPAEPATGHVLLIEDDDLERRRVAALLERAGYDLSLASSGDEGLNLLRDGRFDAVVLDLVMPGMSGLDVLRAARADERLSSIPFVVLSALYMTRSEREVLGPTVAGVVRKGEGIGDELTGHLRRAIDRRGPTTSHTPGPFTPPARNARVLIVEDNDDNLFTIKQVLTALPVSIETARTGREAIDICRRRPPDLILMDVELPGISGLEASRGIRELPDCADIPIIALTADALTGDRERVMAARCSEYLAKPVKPGDVVSAVTRALQLEIH
jgi:CheY-like chemotaxis protein/signal transduction histidine kinase